MVRKCRGRIAEIAVMELDVRTTTASPDLDMPPSPASTSPLAKKRKITTADEEFEFSTTYVDVRRTRTRPVESILPRRRKLAEEHGSSSPTSGYASAFCCSSNGYSELVEERFKDEDDGVEFIMCDSGRERRETTPCSKFRSEDQQSSAEDMESSAAEKNEANSGRRSLSEKMPTESELEQFFIAAEKDIQKRFAEKYNYDIVEDVPLEGRYEWVKLKP